MLLSVAHAHRPVPLPRSVPDVVAGHGWKAVSCGVWMVTVWTIGFLLEENLPPYLSAAGWDLYEPPTIH